MEGFKRREVSMMYVKIIHDMRDEVTSTKMSL